MYDEIKSIENLSDQNFDGSSINQATSFNSEVILKPRTLFNNPFRNYNNKIVLCNAYKPYVTKL